MKMRRSLLAPNLAWLCFAAALFSSGRASAAEECGDQVCPKGFVCASYDLGCPAIDCQDGAECEPCVGSVVSTCVAAPCESDADCGADMVCYTSSYDQCEGSAGCARDDSGDAEGDAAGDADCVEAPPADCSTVTSSVCVARWYLPCQAAADCGAGFTCEEQLQGGCPGSMGSGGGSEGEEATPARPVPADADGGATPGADGGAMPAPEPDPDFAPPSDGGTDGCVFEPSGVSACVRIEQGCDVDSDCLAGWVCGTNNEGACWRNADGSTGCDPVDPAKICYPPYENLGGGVGIAEDGNSTGSGEPPRADTGGEPVPNKGDDDTGANASDDEGDSSRRVTTGSCSVGAANGSGAGFGLSLLAFLGLLAARRRK